MPPPGHTPLARLHDTAMQAGIIVVDAVDDDGPLLDDDTAAFVACGVCIALNPALDDGLRTDVLAMALALTYAMSPGETDHPGDITAADGFVLISRTREAEPLSALGLLATVIAHEHGCGTASAAFEYTVPVFELARRAACTPCARRPGRTGAGAWAPGGWTADGRLGGAVGGVSAAQKRRVWDSNPRGRVNALVVFKTTAIGH
jgi:hypothetical protein